MSIASTIINRFLDRPRLTLEVSFVDRNDRPPYEFAEGEVLLIKVRNPSKENVPIDKVFTSVAGQTWNMNQQLTSSDDCPPCTIPARGRVDYWISKLAVVQTFLISELSGQQGIEVFVAMSTGTVHTSSYLVIDLDAGAKILVQKQEQREIEIGSQIIKAYQQESELERIPISTTSVKSYLAKFEGGLPVSRNEHQFLTVLSHLSELDFLDYSTIRDLDLLLRRTSRCRELFAQKYPPRSSMDQVVRAISFENERYREYGFPLREQEFWDFFESIAKKCISQKRPDS